MTLGDNDSSVSFIRRLSNKTRPLHRWKLVHFFIGLCLGISVTSLLTLFSLTKTQCLQPNEPKRQQLPSTNKSAHVTPLKETKGKMEIGEIKLLCWVLTSPAQHEKRAKHILATWGKRCDTLLFITNGKADPKVLPKENVVVLDGIPDGRQHLWNKTRRGYKYIYDHYIDKADWFMATDDDAYVIVENLRAFVSALNKSEAAYYGCRYKTFFKQGYMSGGPGYVMSKAALEKFGKEGYNNPVKCPYGTRDGDVEVGQCFENLGIVAGDSRDNRGRYRFLPFIPEHHLVPGFIGNNSWFWKYIYYPTKMGKDCCSSSAISFHYVPKNMMYVMDYLIYQLKVKMPRLVIQDTGAYLDYSDNGNEVQRDYNDEDSYYNYAYDDAYDTTKRA